MAKTILRDARIEVSGVNLSDHVRTVEVSSSREEVDLSAMGASYRDIGLGLADATISVTFYQDFAAASVHQTLQALYNAPDTPFNVKIRPTSGAISPTNPEWTMSAKLANYTPISGEVGAASTLDLSFRNAGTAGITEAVS